MLINSWNENFLTQPIVNFTWQAKPGLRPGSGAEGAAKGGLRPPSGAELRHMAAGHILLLQTQGGTGGIFQGNCEVNSEPC